MKTYRDINKCPAGHKVITDRRVTTAGRKVRTYCQSCRKAYQLLAGPALESLDAASRAPIRSLRESDIERYLVAQVKKLGGEVRKVQWIGRRGAPDRLVMLPYDAFNMRFRQTIWIELKAPGVKPEAHQLREHERMRKMGQRVEVVDSFARVDEVLS